MSDVELRTAITAALGTATVVGFTLDKLVEVALGLAGPQAGSRWVKHVVESGQLMPIAEDCRCVKRFRLGPADDPPAAPTDGTP